MISLNIPPTVQALGWSQSHTDRITATINESFGDNWHLTARVGLVNTFELEIMNGGVITTLVCPSTLFASVEAFDNYVDRLIAGHRGGLVKFKLVIAPGDIQSKPAQNLWGK